MSCSVAAVCSDVGVYKQIIEDGKNGYLAGSVDEWVEKISFLIDDCSLREKITKAARKTVENKYSVKASSLKLKRSLESLKR